jgi:hypothetical protein
MVTGSAPASAAVTERVWRGSHRWAVPTRPLLAVLVGPAQHVPVSDPVDGDAVDVAGIALPLPSPTDEAARLQELATLVGGAESVEVPSDEVEGGNAPGEFKTRDAAWSVPRRAAIAF